jgi:transposase
VVACVRGVIDGKAVKETRTFATNTASLIALAKWLTETKCTHIAMEAKGVYWKPVWHILSDEDFKLVLANAAHVKNVPGRKGDVKDADWISDLFGARPAPGRASCQTVAPTSRLNFTASARGVA